MIHVNDITLISSNDAPSNDLYDRDSTIQFQYESYLPAYLFEYVGACTTVAIISDHLYYTYTLSYTQVRPGFSKLSDSIPVTGQLNISCNFLVLASPSQEWREAPSQSCRLYYVYFLLYNIFLILSTRKNGYCWYGNCS